MHFIYKLLILLIIFICLFVVFQLIQHRLYLNQMKNQNDNYMKEREGFESKNYVPPIKESFASFTDTTVTSLQKNNPVNITLSSYPFQNMTAQFGITNPEAKYIKQFCIKSSCNSAYNGQTVSLDMIQYVLSRGCRFLDFEIYWGVPTIEDQGKQTSGTPVPIVSISDDPTTPSTNSISLYSVIKFVQRNGFNKTTCPNHEDPLFVQLRIKYLVTNDSNSPSVFQTLYNSVAEIIHDQLTSQYSAQVNGNTNMTVLKNQIVVIMDTYGNRDYVGSSPALSSIINMESNTNVLTHSTYEDIVTQSQNNFPIDGNGIVTNMKIMQQVLPMSTINGIQYLFTDNYDSMSIISRYSAQFTPMLFWKNDVYLQAYEKMFNTTGTGIMTLSSTMKYADGQKVVPLVSFP
jgi:hypothetical protein